MMVGVGGSMAVCPRSKHCWEWARVYMNYCICDAKDVASFGMGMLSVLSWSIAEVPQIITNCKMKTTEGISVAFLLTWVLGDFFNVFGCWLEPATLPTQFYMALLYTVTTLILSFQTVYYDQIYHRLGTHKTGFPSKGQGCKREQIDSIWNNEKSEGRDKDLALQNDKHHLSTPIPVVAPVTTGYGSLGRDRYYISARSLASSPTPTAGSYLAYQRGGYGKRAPTSSLDHASEKEPLLDSVAQSAPSINTKNVLCMVSVATFFICSLGLQKSASDVSYTSSDHDADIIPISRKLLQKVDLISNGNNGSSSLGSYLGWGMAVIYMGGRLPQICLNMKRGTVEGLNPLMFLFALVGNSTYVASILVYSTEWSKIKPNLPWLVDAAACVVLDTFIIVQFIYYRARTKESNSNRDYPKA